MSKVTVLGGGVCGLASGLMLARDGHEVTVLERDPSAVPETAERAWESWERHGVAQFRQAHFLHALGHRVLEAELPDVHEALARAGAARVDWTRMLPPGITDREPRPGDERLVTLTARRPTLEHLFARAAEAQPGLDVRRGVAAARLELRVRGAALHAAAVWTDGGERLTADLVVDAMGRRSHLPRLVQEAGGGPVAEEAEDSGFIYYTRFFRSRDGRTPMPKSAFLTPFEAFSVLTLPGDSGTWSVTLYAAAGDQPLKRLRHEAAWTAAVRACPLHAHWLEGDPITGVLAMGGVVDRRRRIPGDSGLTGVALVGDAWACTNPSLGRGISLGLAHAALLRSTFAEHGDDPDAFALAWDEATERELTPWYDATVTTDRARLAELVAARGGAPFTVPADPASRLRAALPRAMAVDADVFRAGVEIMGCLSLPAEVFARPGLAERVMAGAAARGDARIPGPGREELLALVSSAGAPAAAR